MIYEQYDLVAVDNKLKQLYIENSLLYFFQPDYSKIAQVMQLYEKISFFENTYIMLYDHKNMQLLYTSENISHLVS